MTRALRVVTVSLLLYASQVAVSGPAAAVGQFGFQSSAQDNPDDGPNWILVGIGVVIVVGLATALKSRGGIGATGERDSDG